MDEWQQYQYEQAKRWLEHIAKLKHAVSASRNMMDLFENLLDSAKGIDYTVEHVSGGQYSDRIAETIIKLDEARSSWAANVVAYADEATDAAMRIKQLEDATEMQALLLHYVDGITWERVCVQMDYSWDGIMSLRKRAVTHAYDIMPLEWRDPLEPAI
ncbi:MAG: hypothetical protein IJ113_06495 [Eggerthellaceae bacterium]|nr:hypothetical protein [Eggerthellaceae bacterium]